MLQGHRLAFFRQRSATVDPTSTVENNLRFPGQYFDNETGLHYNWHRSYDPETGRYTQVDPIGFAGGDVNLYRYVKNSPIKFSDPSGLQGYEGFALGYSSHDLVGGAIDYYSNMADRSNRMANRNEKLSYINGLFGEILESIPPSDGGYLDWTLYGLSLLFNTLEKENMKNAEAWRDWEIYANWALHNLQPLGVRCE